MQGFAELEGTPLMLITFLQNLAMTGPRVTYGETSHWVLPVKALAESARFTFDFLSMLPQGESLGAAAVEVEVYSGTDPAPQDMVLGRTSVAGSRAFQLLQGGVEGVTYRVKCIADSTSSHLMTLVGYLTVEAADVS